MKLKKALESKVVKVNSKKAKVTVTGLKGEVIESEANQSVISVMANSLTKGFV